MGFFFSLRLHFKVIWPIVKMSSVSFVFFLSASFSASLPFMVCAVFVGPTTEEGEVRRFHQLFEKGSGTKLVR